MVPRAGASESTGLVSLPTRCPRAVLLKMQTPCLKAFQDDLLPRGGSVLRVQYAQRALLKLLTISFSGPCFPHTTQTPRTPYFSLILTGLVHHAGGTLFLLPRMFFPPSWSELLILLQEPRQLSSVLETPPRSQQGEAVPSTAVEPLTVAHLRASDSVTQLCKDASSLLPTHSSINSGVGSVSPQCLVQLLAISRQSISICRAEVFKQSPHILLVFYLRLNN